MNRDDIKHRFANRLEGKNGSIKAGNVSYEGRCYYSYYTVFGQWLDVEKNVVAIFDGSTSTSSNRHKLYSGVFSSDVHVFPLDLGDGYGWRNCNLIGKYANKDSDFKLEHRMVMINHYVGRIYDQLAAINGGKCKGLENVDFSAWKYVEELCSLYKDTTIKKYIKWLSRSHYYGDLAMRLDEGERDVETLVDYLFGVGTFKTYMAYSERFRKAETKRMQITTLAHRIGIQSPYESEWRTKYMPTTLRAGDIRKLSAKERLDLHFNALIYRDSENNRKVVEDKRYKNECNAFKWVTGYDAQPHSTWDRSLRNPFVVRNMFTGEEYNLICKIYTGVYWCDDNVKFDYADFRHAKDKNEWLVNFYAKCSEVANNLKAMEIMSNINAHTKENPSCYGIRYVDDDFLVKNTTEEEYALCADFIKRQEKYFTDREARIRAEEIARLKREEEERTEREYMKQVKQEQIKECLDNGLEGRRDLWRKHFMSISEAESYNDSRDDSEFFFGGNVLLRLNLKGDTIETSKNIRIPVEKCKKMWKIVQKWHNDPSSFKSCEINTLSSGKYTISSYKNDILTSGCHQIPYVEMERIMAMVN